MRFYNKEYSKKGSAPRVRRHRIRKAEKARYLASISQYGHDYNVAVADVHAETGVGKILDIRSANRVVRNIQRGLYEQEIDPARCRLHFELNCVFNRTQNATEMTAHITSHKQRGTNIDRKGKSQRNDQRSLGDRDTWRCEVTSGVHASFYKQKDGTTRRGLKLGETLYWQDNPNLYARQFYDNDVHALRNQAAMIDYVGTVRDMLEENQKLPNLQGRYRAHQSLFTELQEDKTVHVWVSSHVDGYPTRNALVSHHTQISTNIDLWTEEMCSSSFTSFMGALWQGNDKNNPRGDDVIAQYTADMETLDKSCPITFALPNGKNIHYYTHSKIKGDWPAAAGSLLFTLGASGKYFCEKTFKYAGM